MHCTLTDTHTHECWREMPRNVLQMVSQRDTMPRFFRLAEEHYYQHGSTSRAAVNLTPCFNASWKLCLAAAEQWAILSGWYPLLQQLLHLAFGDLQILHESSNGVTSYHPYWNKMVFSWQPRERYNKIEQDATNPIIVIIFVSMFVVENASDILR